MVATDKNNKTTRRDRLRLLLNGINLHLQNITTMTIGGVVHQLADIKAAIAADIAACDAAEKGHAEWLQLVEEERASHAVVDPLVSGVHKYVRLEIGDTDAVQGALADFGMSPRKVVVRTAADRAASAAKARATRAAKAPKAAAPAAPAEPPAPAVVPAPATK